MKEAYVSYDVAKLLREKGFNWPTIEYYSSSGSIYRFTDGIADICGIMSYQRPTQQMAMRWLREERGIHIYPIPVTGFNYVVSVYVEDGNKVHNRILSRSGRHAYEDAVEAALQYVLNNLI